MVRCAGYDGTVSIVQPMIDPMYGGHTAHEILQSLLDNPDVSAYDAVRATWKDQLSKGDAEFNWRKVLHDGWIDGTAFTAEDGDGEGAGAPAPVRPRRAAWKWPSGPMRTSTTDATRTWAGCRRFRGR